MQMFKRKSEATAAAAGSVVSTSPLPDTHDDPDVEIVEQPQ